MSTADSDREEDEWDRVANIMATVINFAGMGTKEPVSPQDLFSLRKYEEDSIKVITSLEDVKELLEQM